MYVVCSIQKKIVTSDLMKGPNMITAVLLGYGKHSTDISVGDSNLAGFVRMPSSITPAARDESGVEKARSLR